MLPAQGPERQTGYVLDEDPVPRDGRLRPRVRLGDLVALDDIEGRVALAGHHQLAVALEDEEEVAGALQSALGALTGLGRSEEHTSELQSQSNLVCRLLLEKK